MLYYIINNALGCVTGEHKACSPCLIFGMTLTFEHFCCNVFPLLCPKHEGILIKHVR